MYILDLCMELNQSLLFSDSLFSSEFNNKKKALLALLIVVLFTTFYAVITDKSSYFWVPAIFMSVTLGLLNIHRYDVLKKTAH